MMMTLRLVTRGCLAEQPLLVQLYLLQLYRHSMLIHIMGKCHSRPLLEAEQEPDMQVLEVDCLVPLSKVICPTGCLDV
jgi:hypothetical protein